MLNIIQRLYLKKMKPKHIKGKRAKEVRLIYKQLNAIRKQQRALGYYKLEKPIRHGWYKEIIITENVERYKNKKAIQEVYKKIEKQFWGKNKEDATKTWFKQVSKNLIYKDFPTLSHKQFNKLSDKAKKLCVVYRFKDANKKIRTRFYVKIPKGAYRIRFKRAFVTHRQKIDPKLEQAKDLLWQQLIKNGYYEEHQKIYNYKDDWKLNPIHKSRKQIKSALKNIHIENYQDM